MSTAWKKRSNAPAEMSATVVADVGASSSISPPSVHEDYRVPGTRPDHAGAWPDEKDHAQDAISNAHAIAEAAILAVTAKKTGDRDSRFMFLNTLDRVDDPETRHKMMDHYKSITGEKLDTTIKEASWHSGRDKQQALDLISEKRDEAHHTLAALPPEERKTLDGDAEKWAAQILDVTRIDTANDDVNARQITNVLGQRKPHEIEAIRAAIRAQTRGTKERSIYEELDRSLSEGNEDEALAGLRGDPVHSANMGLINAHGDADRVQEILGRLKPEQLDELEKRNSLFGTGTDWIAASVPSTQQAEVAALLENRRDGDRNPTADGAHIAELFSDPVKRLSTHSMLDDQRMKDLESHKAENIINELRVKTPDQIHAARQAWEAAHPNRSWDSLIEQRFGAGDANMYLRMKALAHGDKVGERAYALRDAMRTHDQAAIEAALTDSSSAETADPMQKALAHAERLALMGRMRELDAHDQRATASMTGADPTKIAGRTLDQQLEASYADYVATEPSIDSGSVIRTLPSYKDADERSAQARDYRTATTELLEHGDLSTATRIHRAQQSGNHREEAKLLDGLKTNARLAEVSKDFGDKYGGEMLKPLATDHFSLYAQTFGESDDPEAVAKLSEHIALDAMSSDSQKVADVRDFGVRAERDPALQYILQKRVNAKAHSDSLDGSDALRLSRGGNAGMGDLVRAGEERMARQFDPNWDGVSGQPRKLREGVTVADFGRADDVLSQHQDTLVDEKLRHAEKEASAFMMPLKLAALFSGNPLLYAMLDGITSVGGMAVKQEIAGGDYNSSDDLKGLGIQTVANFGSAGLSSLSAAKLISETTATAGNLGLQIGASLGAGIARDDSSATMGLDAGRAIVGSFLPAFLGKGAEGLIRGNGGIANLARKGLGFVTRGAANYGVNGGGGIQGAVDAFGNAAGDTLHANGSQPGQPDVNTVAFGHYAEHPQTAAHSEVTTTSAAPRIEASERSSGPTRSDTEIELELHVERMRELQATGAQTRSGFHGTSTDILPGLRQTDGALLSAKELANRGIQQASGEGDTFSYEEGLKDEVFIGVGEGGLGTGLAYASANHSLQQYNPSIIRHDDLQKQIATLTELVARYPEVSDLARRGGVVDQQGRPRGGHFEQRGHQSRGQLVSSLERLQREERLRAVLARSNPSDPRVLGGPDNNANHPLLFEFDTLGLNQRSVPRFGGDEFAGEAVVRQPIDLTRRMSRAYAPLNYLDPTRQHLATIFGHDNFEMLAIEALQAGLPAGGTSQRAYDATLSTVTTLQNDVLAVQRMYLEALRTGKPIDQRTLIQALLGKKIP